MNDFTDYKIKMENEVGDFKNQINPTLNNSPKQGSDRLSQFLKILPEVENHMDGYCKKYFDGQTLNSEEKAELIAINTKIYNDFIDYCKIPGLSKK